MASPSAVSVGALYSDSSRVTLDFLHKIAKTMNDLGVSASTASVLLIEYKWDEALLASHMRSVFSQLQKCVPEAQPVDIQYECSKCEIGINSVQMNCGCIVCRYCLSRSVKEQLKRGNLILLCPVVGCDRYINMLNLPDELLNAYVHALISDLQQKTAPPSCLVKCLSFAWRHKVAAVSSFSVGYALYKGFCYRDYIKYGVKLFRVGSEVKTWASSASTFGGSLKNEVMGFFSGK